MVAIKIQYVTYLDYPNNVPFQTTKMLPLTKNRVLYLITYLSDFSFFLVIFTVSRDLAEMNTSLLKMGIIGGGCSLAYAISSLIFGSLSDRLGRRRIIFVGLILTLLNSLGCFFLNPVNQIYFLFYWGFSASIGLIYSPLIAWLNQDQDSHAKSFLIQKSLIRFCFSWNMGLICGQLTGGFFFPFGRQWPLFLAVILILAKIILLTFSGKCLLLAQKSKDTKDINIESREVAKGFTTLSWLSNLSGAFSMSMIIHLFPMLAVSLNIPSQLHGSILASMRLTALLTYFLMYRSQFWHYRYSFSIMIQFIGIVGLVFIIKANTLWTLIVGLSGVALLTGYNYFSGLYYSSASRSDASRGFSCGMHEATLGLGFAAGAIGGGFVGSLAGTRSPYQLGILVILVLMIIQLIIYFRSIKPLQTKN